MKVLYAAGVAASMMAFSAPALAADGAPAPLDPQNWSWQDELTWNDYKKLPGPDYSDPSIQPTVKKWKVALVVTDFPGTPLAITQPENGTVFGTPTAQAHDVPRAQAAEWYRDFLNTPQAINNFQTMNRYWMEDSFGKYGVQLDAFGPYQLPGTQYQYFLGDQSAGNRTQHCPNLTPAKPCTLNFRTDARAAWEAAVGAAKIAEYDNVFYVSAGEDESSTWQEFGEMKWNTPEEVPDAFGPKALGDPLQTNWALTRYVPWTSWVSAATNWPNASGNTSVEAESSGMSTYAHELSHNLSIPDNYGNPYGATQQRGFTGMWDMMSRGTFNGPGGPHTRFLIPPTQGSSLGSQHNVRNKRFLNFVGDSDLVRLNRNGLASSGLAVADVTAREVPHSTGEVAGVRIELDGSVGDNSAPCVVATDWRCDGVRTSGDTVTGKYNAYTMEVVQQIGSDSFDPGHGVLITKVKNSSSNCGANVNCFAWVIDSHPDDINHVDFIRPDGTPKLATLGDERQLNDASFNAGLDSGSSYEWTDERNRLHFYVVDTSTDAQGILHYKVAVKSLDGAGPQTARRRAAGRGLDRDRGGRVVHVHLPAQEHGRRGGHRSGPAPAGLDRVPGLGRLPPVGVGFRHRLDGEAPQRPDRRQVRRVGERAGLRHEGLRRLGLGLGLPDRDLRERPVRDPDRDLRPGLGRRRRDRPGDALADHGHAGLVRRVHAGRRQGLRRLHHGQRRLDRR